jgi:bifunctional non-homologous end joining protein LigD
MVRPSLDTYRRKRDFLATPEPRGKVEKGAGGRFVVHEHHASRLHFDLRLEMGGVLKSFAVPKGPSLDPKVRRLAVNTEDHPVKYLTFQGSIGDGQYGAGQMVIWDSGTYSVSPGGDPLEQYAQGRLHLQFRGEKMRGGFMLIRGGRGDRQWLLFKKRDGYAEEGSEPGLILPYGSRTEKPDGFEIPKEALRKTSAAKPAAESAAKPAAKTPAETAVETAGKNARGRKAALGKWPAGAKTAPLPDFLPPMLATLADKAFDDPDWVFETKWDGWRALLRKDASGVHLISRSGKSMDHMFPELVELGGRIPAESCMLDGEIVVLDGEGVPRFQLLQNRLKGRGFSRGKAWESGNKAGQNRAGQIKAGLGMGARNADAQNGLIAFYAFDLPFCGGRDLTACGLLDRKALLRKLIPETSSAGSADLRFSEHFEGRGKDVFEQAVRLGFEGMLAKLKHGPYRKGRSSDWLKVKSKARQEVVIGGYTRARGSRSGFGSLVAGLYRGGEFIFAGHVGGGFNERLLKEVLGFMEPLKTAASPFSQVPKTNEKVQWIKPKLVAEVEFAEWTDDGRMRQPVFLGLRPDKDPKACVRERAGQAESLVAEAENEARKGARPPEPGERGDEADPVPAERGKEGSMGNRNVTLEAAPAGRAKAGKAGIGAAEGPVITHPDKILWPGEGYTKADLIGYYRAIAPLLLPHLKDRPLILKRYPNGIESPPFYQHDVKSAPAFVKTIPVKEPDGSVIHYVLCQNEETLVWLANMGVIPQNPWLSRHPRLSRPDWIVFDLDPQEVAFPEVCSLASYLKEILDGLGLKSFPKTSGSRGIHIYVPLKPIYDFSQSLDFAQLVAAYAEREKPDAFTVERSLKIRKRDRVYLDCMQNSEGKSVASVYSVREKPGATVSAPLDWPELKKKIRMEDFDIRTMPKRVAKKGDLFADVLKSGNALEGALKKLERLF